VWRARLESWANIAIIGTGILFFVTVGFRMWRARALEPARAPAVADPRTAIDSSYRLGDSLVGTIHRIDYSSSRWTLVLAIKTTCSQCAHHIALTKRIMAERAPSVMRLVVVSPQPRSELQGYLDVHGLGADAIVSVKRDSLRLTEVPTMLLLNSRGRVCAIWTGPVPAEVERDVIDLLRLAPPPSFSEQSKRGTR